MIEECQACGSRDLLETETSSKGGYGPALLPGTGSFGAAKFRIVVCAQCGFVHWFVKRGDLDKVRKSKRFWQVRNR
ncbi:MAG TPA: hypothetical protein DDW87_07590 [Firmicutes bacterium]|nr:hypothetical protein [Bacillota bacterium]